MRRLHILIGAFNRDIKIEIKTQYRPGDQHHEDGEGGVLEIRDLDLHGTELDPPADVVPGGGRLEADVLPVGGLEVFEVVGFGEI